MSDTEKVYLKFITLGYWLDDKKIPEWLKELAKHPRMFMDERCVGFHFYSPDFDYLLSAIPDNKLREKLKNDSCDGSFIISDEIDDFIRHYDIKVEELDMTVPQRYVKQIVGEMFTRDYHNNVKPNYHIGDKSKEVILRYFQIISGEIERGEITNSFHF